VEREQDLLVPAARAQSDILGGTFYWGAVQKVALVEGDFNPADPTTWPAPSTNFSALDSDSIWEVWYDAVAANNKFLLPEPEGGWNFPAVAAGPSITGFIVRDAADLTKKTGAAIFATPIPITAAGQLVVLPNISVPADGLFQPVDSPYVLT